MKYLTLLFLFTILWAQTSSQPSLNTAEQVALQALEQRKGEAQKQFQDAQKAEQTIINEWQLSHKGFHLDPQTFMIEPDPLSKVPAIKNPLPTIPVPTKGSK